MDTSQKHQIGDQQHQQQSQGQSQASYPHPNPNPTQSKDPQIQRSNSNDPNNENFKNLPQPPLLLSDPYTYPHPNRPIRIPENNMYYAYHPQYPGPPTQQYYPPYYPINMNHNNIPPLPLRQPTREQQMIQQRPIMVNSQPQMIPNNQIYQINPNISYSNQVPPQMYPQNNNNKHNPKMGQQNEGQYYEYPQNQNYGNNYPASTVVQRNVTESEDSKDMWQKKFFYIFQRFQEEYQRFDELKTDYEQLCEQLKIVDSEEDWNQLKSNHEELYQNFNQMHEQLSSVILKIREILEGNNQDYQQIWKIRYYELLANFKAMEDQITQLRQQQPKSYNPEHQQLVNQYHDLEVEYSNVINELNELKHRDDSGAQINDYRDKLQYALQEGQRYKSILDKLHEQNEELQSYIQQMEEQANQQKRQANSRNKVDRSEFQQLFVLVNQKQQALGEARMKNQFNVRENKRLTEELNLKEKEILDLREAVTRNKSQSKSSSVSDQYNKIIKIKTEQINQYRSMLKAAEQEFKISIKDHQETLTKQYDQKISGLKREVKRLETRLSEALNTEIKPLPANNKIQSYEKKIEYYEQEVINLNQTLTKRNQQLLELRGISYEVEKAKTLQLSIQTLNQQNNQFKEVIKGKNKQIDSLKVQISEHEARYRSSNQKKTQITSKQLIQQTQSLKQNLVKKDNELNRIKQLLQGKQNQVTQMQNECDKIKTAKASNEKSFEVQRESIGLKIKNLEALNLEQEKKLRHLEFQFGDSMKNNLKTEINSLRAQNLLKQQTISKLEAEKLQIETYSSNLERQKKDIESDLDECHTKIAQFERWKVDYTKQINQAFMNLQSRDRQIKDMQLHEITLKGQFNSLKQQVQDLLSTLRAKNTTIKQFEDQIAKLNQISTELSQQLDSWKNKYKSLQQETCQEVLELTEKIKQSQSLNLLKSRAKGDSEANNQTNVINFLKSQNQRLKVELSRSFESQVGQRSKGAEGLSYIQKRLFQFNSKLQGMIVTNNYNPYNPNKPQSPTSKKSDFEFNREDFSNLKQKLIHLQRYCGSLEVRLGNNERLEQNPKNTLIFEHQEAQHQRQIEFYKQKSLQFEERVDSLLKVNHQLKARVQSLLKSNNEFSPINFYKEQASIAEKNVENLMQKLKKINDENWQIKRQLSQTNSKFNFQKDERVSELEGQIHELNRKIRNLELEKTTLNNEKTNLNHKLTKQQSDFQIIHASLEQKLFQYQNHSEQLMSRCNAYENQIQTVNTRNQTLEQNQLKLSRKIVDIQERGYFKVKTDNKIESSSLSPVSPKRSPIMLRDTPYVM